MKPGRILFQTRRAFPRSRLHRGPFSSQVQGSIIIAWCLLSAALHCPGTRSFRFLVNMKAAYPVARLPCAELHAPHKVGEGSEARALPCLRRNDEYDPRARRRAVTYPVGHV